MSKRFGDIVVEINCNQSDVLNQLKEIEVFAKLMFEPQENITTYELARVMQLLMTQSNKYGRSQFTPAISLYTLEAYNKFVKKYSDILRHFNIGVYGNVEGKYE